MTKRRSFSDKSNVTVALEALRGDKTAQEIAAKHNVHPTHVTTWKRQAIDGLTGDLSDKVRKAEDNEAKVKGEDWQTGGWKWYGGLRHPVGPRSP